MLGVDLNNAPHVSSSESCRRLPGSINPDARNDARLNIPQLGDGPDEDIVEIYIWFRIGCAEQTRFSSAGEEIRVKSDDGIVRGLRVHSRNIVLSDHVGIRALLLIFSMRATSGGLDSLPRQFRNAV